MHLCELEVDALRACSSTSSDYSGFDVSKHICLVPPFKETEEDTYFSAFECIAASLHWPWDV